MGVTEERGERLSFTAAARRAQIIDAAIETIAQHGFGAATFARIAEHAELSSTRLISYHFKDKQELIDEVVGAILAELGGFVGERMARETTARGALRAYLRASSEFTDTRRSRMKALLAVFTSGALPFDPTDQAPILSPLEKLLRDGQAAGEFRDFDPLVMASVVQRSVEGLPMLLETRPDLDVGAYSDEIWTLFDLATRRTP